MKKLISVMLALTMIFALTACTAKAPTQTEPAASVNTETFPTGQTPEEPQTGREPENPVPDEAPAEVPENTPVEEPEAAGGGILIAYFSCTGTTKTAAEQLAALTDADLYEIVPEEPYTSDDLNYNSDCRANREQNDLSVRPAIAGELPDLTQYDTVLLGYPIWWGTLPKIIMTFTESSDFSSKVILPFCTSGGSGIDASVTALRELLPDADVRDGLRMNGVTEEEMQNWLAENGAASKTEEQPVDTAKRIRFLVGEDEIVVQLEDNPAAESLYEMLPMELNFEDYNSTEKIAYPDETLRTDGAPDRCTPHRGDLCFYAPWGNLCFFYRDFRESPSLVPLGTVESGVEYLESLNTVASVTAEAAE